jgi:hypothetical protein
MSTPSRTASRRIKPLGFFVPRRLADYRCAPKEGCSACVPREKQGCSRCVDGER